MRGFFITPQKNIFYRCLSGLIVFVLTFSLIFSPTASYAQSVFTLSGVEGLNLPVPGTMVHLSPAFAPVLLKGMTIHPDDPLKFDFIIDSGNTYFTVDEIKKESERLVKYFLASMTVPKDDLWVNLSPYEDDRIIPEELGKTELGRDMLAQDYILKQLTASMMYPEKELGKRFWDKIYQRAEEEFGTSEIPVNTFNKVWILPESATVYEHEQTVYIVDAKLKVMLDSDYMAMDFQQKSTAKSRAPARGQALQHEQKEGSEKLEVRSGDLELQSSIIKEIILPEIEREVNEGEHFAPLRQIYHSLILAKWYKETIKNSLLSQVYVDQNKIAGVDVDDKTIKDQIYAQYMEAYKKGVFNYIKEDYDRLSQEIIPRKYFSGGLLIGAGNIHRTSSPVNDSENPQYRASVEVIPQRIAQSGLPVSLSDESSIKGMESEEIAAFREEISMRRLIFLGRPGSGKSTHSKTLGRILGIPYISASDLLHEVLESSHAAQKYDISDGLRQEIRDTMRQGEMVHNVVTDQIIQKRLSQPDAKNGFILDGYPRQADSADALDKFLDWQGLKVDGYVVIDISEEEVRYRLGLRKREDDINEDAVNSRLRVFDEETKEVLASRQDLVINVPGSRDEYVTRKAMFEGLKSKSKKWTDPDFSADDQSGSPVDTKNYKPSVQGRFFRPKLDFDLDQPLSADEITKLRLLRKRDSKAVRQLFEKAEKQNIILRSSGYLRGADILGSSLDLRSWIFRLTKKGIRGFDRLPSTITVASNHKLSIRYERAENEDENVYVAPMFGLTEDNPRIYKEAIVLKNGKVPNGIIDAVQYIFMNVLGITGVKVILEPATVMSRFGGVESSGTFLKEILSVVSIMTGADLSEADLNALVVKFENNEFGNLAGFQGPYNATLGGVQQIIMTSGIKDSQGRLVSPNSVVAVPLLTDEKLRSLENVMMFVQAGKPYKDGQSFNRTAGLVNTMWTDSLVYEDPEVLPLFFELLKLTTQTTAAFENAQWDKVSRAMMRYAEIRDLLAKRWLNLMLDAHTGKQVPEYAKAYAKTYADKVFDPANEHYKSFEVVRDIFNEHGEDILRETRFYAFGPMGGLSDDAKEEGIALVGGGAGGPGANMFALDPQGKDHLLEFFHTKGFSEIDETEALSLIEGRMDGTLKGYLPFKIGSEGMQYEGFARLGLSLPAIQDVRKIKENEVGLSSSPVESGKDAPMSAKDFDRLIREYKNLFFASNIVGHIATPALKASIREGIEESPEVILWKEISSRRKKLSAKLDGYSSRSDGLFVMGRQYKDMGFLFMWSKKIYNKEVSIPRAVARIFKVNDTGTVMKHSLSENPEQFFDDLAILEKTHTSWDRRFEQVLDGLELQSDGRYNTEEVIAKISSLVDQLNQEDFPGRINKPGIWEYVKYLFNILQTIKKKEEIDKIPNILTLDDVALKKDADWLTDDASSPINAQSEDVGGIDLNKVEIDRQGAGVDIQFDPVEVRQIIDMGIDGFAPVIINITPLPSVLPLLGLAPKRQEEFELSKVN